MKRLLRFALIATLGLLGFASAEPTRYSSELDSKQVYEALLLRQGQHSAMLVSTTVNPTTCLPGDSEMPDNDFRWALSDFRSATQQKEDISGWMSDYDMIREDEIDSFFKSGVMEGWKQFRAAHPKSPAYLRLSVVGFNADHSVAMVYSEVHCSPKCGAGGFHCFRREHGQWKKVERDIPDCRWIS